jgi:putative Mg2+ transporter-C (MgtC) family protein
MDATEMFLRLGGAAIRGAAIGIDREVHHKSAGFRTIAIVCVGAALAAVTVSIASPDPGSASRVIQGTLAGIGFLGGGVIIHHSKLGSVEGLTTAASIWTAAAIGTACGLGLWEPVLMASALVVALLVVGGAIEKTIRKRSGSVE